MTAMVYTRLLTVIVVTKLSPTAMGWVVAVPHKSGVLIVRCPAVVN